MAKKIPLRKCLGCGEMRDKRNMLRVVKPKEGDIHFDPTGRSNGRGAYICNTAVCLEKAFKTKGFDRSFKTRVSEDVYDSLKEAFTSIE